MNTARAIFYLNIESLRGLKSLFLVGSEKLFVYYALHSFEIKIDLFEVFFNLIFFRACL